HHLEGGVHLAELVPGGPRHPVPKLRPGMEIVRVGSVASTQELARSRPIGSAVVADHQQAGRGRLGRVWEAPPGTALLASFVLRYQPLAPLAAGVAAAEACGPSVRLKWPNDLLLEGRKLGGILVEAVGDRCVVGGRALAAGDVTHLRAVGPSPAAGEAPRPTSPG